MTSPHVHMALCYTVCHDDMCGAMVQWYTYMRSLMSRTCCSVFTSVKHPADASTVLLVLQSSKNTYHETFKRKFPMVHCTPW